MLHSQCNRAALVAVATTLIGVLPLVARAGEVHNRIEHQQRRISQGVSSGQLTRHEYSNVTSREHAINQTRLHDLHANGGHLTAAESRNLNNRENRLSHSIYFDKHNVRVQPGTPH